MDKALNRTAQEREIARIDDGGDTTSFGEPVDLSVKKPLDASVLIRIDRETYGAVRRLAHERGIGPSTLIRMWVKEHVRAATTSR